MKRLFLKAAGAAAAGALLKACGGGGGGSGGSLPDGGDTLLGLLQQDGNFSLLLQAADRAGLISTLGDASQSLTMFAPDNAALERLAGRVGQADGAALIGALRGDQWANILNFALLPQRRSRGSLTPSSNGQDIRLDTRYASPIGVAQLIFVNGGGTLYLWDGVGRSLITLQRSDLAASNGVAHVPSDVLLPRFVLTVSQMLRVSIDSLSNFGAAMSPDDINELDGPGPFTVFVPTNDAPGAINVPRHVVARQLGSDSFPTTTAPYTTLGGTTTRLTRGTTPPRVVNGRSVLATLTDSTPVLANVVDVDFFGSNGVIHVLDKVLA